MISTLVTSDRFGNALIDAWLATQGRRPESFDAVERLCYIGIRGMGALEFRPVVGPPLRASKKISLDALVDLASDVLSHRNSLQVSFSPKHRHASLTDILRVGTSAGGARAKAIIAWNPDTQEVRSGQVTAPAGFGYWLLKFDGVTANKDKELEDPKGFTAIEYAYALMAKAAGITMSECRLRPFRLQRSSCLLLRAGIRRSARVALLDRHQEFASAFFALTASGEVLARLFNGGQTVWLDSLNGFYRRHLKP